MSTDKTHPITIRVSTEMLNEIDSRIPDRRRVCREQFVMDAVQAYLGHPDKVLYKDPDMTEREPEIVKAISESTDDVKTGRYEP